VIFRDETIMGKATGLDEDGSLILLTDKNETLLVSAGDATIVKR
jgi:biotin-(acetyl-CoA carboxylase) ligase